MYIERQLEKKNRAIIPVSLFSALAGRIQMPVWKPPVSLLSAGGLRCPVTTTLKQS